jgi:hypothetical protein
MRTGSGLWLYIDACTLAAQGWSHEGSCMMRECVRSKLRFDLISSQATNPCQFSLIFTHLCFFS